MMRSSNNSHGNNNDTTVIMVQPAGPTMSTGDVPVEDLIPCCGGCCFIASCYTEFPDCCGAVSEQTCLCINPKLIMCKSSKEPDACCKCCLLDCDVIPIRTCCKARLNQLSFQRINNNHFSRQGAKYAVWMDGQHFQHLMNFHASLTSVLSR